MSFRATLLAIVHVSCRAALCSALLFAASTGAATGARPLAQRPDEKGDAVAAVEYLDHLRSCTPYTYQYPEPLARSIGEVTIRGKSGNTCRVILRVPNSYLADCEFSPAAIKALTAGAKYRAARAGKLSGSLTEAEDQRFGRQCKRVFYPGQVGSTPQD